MHGQVTVIYFPVLDREKKNLMKEGEKKNILKKKTLLLEKSIRATKWKKYLTNF